MESLIGSKAAVLQALLRGPGYGLELLERVAGRTAGRLQLAQASAYPALRELEGEGLVRSWTQRRVRRGAGRPRRYYELTSKGLRQAMALRDALRSLAGPLSPQPSLSERRAMELRLRRGLELSEFATRLRAPTRKTPATR